MLARKRKLIPSIREYLLKLQNVGLWLSEDFINEICRKFDKELSVYHANILERFCLQQGVVSGEYNTKRDYFEIHDSSRELTGGGMWSVDEEAKTLSFFGASQMYGKYDHVGLKKKVLTHTAFSGFTVIVEGCRQTYT